MAFAYIVSQSDQAQTNGWNEMLTLSLLNSSRKHHQNNKKLSCLMLSRPMKYNCNPITDDSL